MRETTNFKFPIVEGTDRTSWMMLNSLSNVCEETFTAFQNVIDSINSNSEDTLATIQEAQETISNTLEQLQQINVAVNGFSAYYNTLQENDVVNRLNTAINDLKNLTDTFTNCGNSKYVTSNEKTTIQKISDLYGTSLPSMRIGNTTFNLTDNTTRGCGSIITTYTPTLENLNTWQFQTIENMLSYKYLMIAETNDGKMIMNSRILPIDIFSKPFVNISCCNVAIGSFVVAYTDQNRINVHATDSTKMLVIIGVV